jgi:hypothetical protein
LTLLFQKSVWSLSVLTPPFRRLGFTSFSLDTALSEIGLAISLFDSATEPPKSLKSSSAESGDQETVAALLPRIGDKPMMNAWGTMGRFEKAKRLANPEK